MDEHADENEVFMRVMGGYENSARGSRQEEIDRCMSGNVRVGAVGVPTGWWERWLMAVSAFPPLDGL